MSERAQCRMYEREKVVQIDDEQLDCSGCTSVLCTCVTQCDDVSEDGGRLDGCGEQKKKKINMKQINGVASN